MFWFDAIHYILPCRIPEWPPPRERSLAHFSILGSSKTSEAIRAFPVERSQQPHDLINGDKHKPALTSVALRSNKDAAQVQPNKLLLQGARAHTHACVYVCIVFIISLLWCFDLFQTVLDVVPLWLCSALLIKRWFVRRVTAADAPLSLLPWQNTLGQEFLSLLYSLWFHRTSRWPGPLGRSHFTVQSGILINWPVL